ncbi:MAG: type II toxin-antitoxin system MqsA family antitoxin [Chitinophagales bacterium]
MKCAICKNGETHPGFATVTLERNESVIVFKNVPAEICDNCGEFYIDEKTSADLLRKAETAVSNGTVFEVQNLKVA